MIVFSYTHLYEKALCFLGEKIYIVAIVPF